MADQFTQSTTEPTLTSLVNGILTDVRTLISQQFTLMRSEVQEEVRQARNAAISYAAAVVIGGVGALLLILMMIHLLEAYTDIPLWGCYGIVGGVLLALGATLYFFGRTEASHVELTPPPQTAEALRENVEWVRSQTVGSNR